MFVVVPLRRLRRRRLVFRFSEIFFSIVYVLYYRVHLLRVPTETRQKVFARRSDG